MAATMHLVPLAGGSWQIWRTVGLRGAGFPARCTLGLAAPRSAAAIDALLAAGGTLDAQSSAAIKTVFEQELAETRRELLAFASDPRVREALVWQNRAFLRRMDHSMRHEAGERRASRRSRQHREASARTLAMYMQRYCLKNDQIGFFGPKCWARVVDDGPAISVHPGPGLVEHRTTAFENWAIEKVADTFAKRCDVRSFVPPRLSPFLDVEGDRLLVPFRDPVPLTPGQAAALKMCDGTRTVGEICAVLLADPRYGVQSAEEIVKQLQMAEQLGALSWSLTVPLDPAPEARLRELVAHCEDVATRTAVLADLDELAAGKKQVEKAAGDPVRLNAAIEGVEESFRRITGADASRRAGEMYAGRTIIYEDCRRAADVRIGPALLNELGPALTLLLDSARWFSWHVARKYREAVESRFDELAAGSTKPVAVVELFDWFRQTYMREGVLELAAAERELQARWARLVAPHSTAPIAVSSASLLRQARETFSAPKPGWPLAYFAPDVMIAADSADAICRGEFLGVLGEMHYSNTINHGSDFTQHPDVEQLFRALECDYPEQHVATTPAGDSYRLSSALVARHHYRLLISAQPVACSPDRLLRIGELVASREDGTLMARSRDGRAAAVPAEALLGLWLEEACGKAHVSLFPLERHNARITIDKLVISRESWRFQARELDFPREKGLLPRFLAARRLVHQHEFPRHVFAHVQTETKPVFVDFDSPILIDCLARMIRSALRKDPEATVTFSEMLPGIDQSWLSDAAGNRYVAELRIVALRREE